jgi:hypothetical protein
MKTLLKLHLIWCFTITVAFGNNPIENIKKTKNQTLQLDCPATLSVSCIPPAAFENLEAFLDGGGDFSGDEVDSTSFVMISEVAINCEIRRIYSLKEKNSTNTATCTHIINISGDNAPPVARCRNFTVNLAGTSGNVSITPQQINNNSSDDCGIDSLCFLTNSGATICDLQVVGCNDIGSDVIFTLKVTDYCGRSSTCTSTVTVSTCPSPRNMALNSNCSLTIPNVTSNLNLFQFCNRNITTATQDPLPGTVIPNLQNNDIVAVRIIVRNNGGLIDTCYMDIIAKDSIPPTIVCKPTILQAFSNTFVNADTLIQSANDNCSSSPITFSVKRSVDNCDDTPSNFRPYVDFCCSDVGRDFTLIVQATNSKGNAATCIRQVAVKDLTPPAFALGSLPDITVSCSYPLDVNNLSDFGTFVHIDSTRRRYNFVGPGDPIYPTGLTFEDGYFSSCDGGTVTTTVSDERNLCSAGRIARNFVVTDRSGVMAQYTQYIYVRDINPFTEADIIWPPAKINFNGCSSSIPPISVTGQPTLRNDLCSKATATYKDQTFVRNVCGFIRRTWTVIDWCQYIPNSSTGIGKWTFVQTINFVNSVPPTILGSACKDTTICASTNCTANVSFSISATDDCLPVQVSYSYKFDQDNNGTFDLNGNTNTFSRTLNVGKHALTWVVKDKCLNSKTCKSIITIKDCTAPALTLRNGLAATLDKYSKTVTIWAKDFVYSASDNCTPASQIKYSFSSTNFNITSRVFTCADKGLKPIDIYAMDLAGNVVKLTSTIHIQDNYKICPNLKNGYNNDHFYTTESRTRSISIEQPAPNPFHDRCSFEINSQKACELTWSIWGLDGKIIHSSVTNVSMGQNKVEISDLGHLSPGVYFIKLSFDDLSESFRLTKI